MWLGWSTTAKHFSVKSRGKFCLSVLEEYGPVVFLLQIFRYFPALKGVILVEYLELFILGKYLMDS